MRWKFERENYEIYKCFMCLHVRTGALILGLLHLVLYTVAICFLVGSFIHPEWIQFGFENYLNASKTLNSNNNNDNNNNNNNNGLINSFFNNNNNYHTALSNNNNNNVNDGIKDNAKINNIATKNDDAKFISKDEYVNNANINKKNNLNETVTRHHRYTKEFIYDNILIMLLLSIGSLSITLFLIYGTLTGKAQYITPFFCIQVFTLCLTGMTMLGYFSDIPNLKKWLSSLPEFPMKSRLLSLDNDQLTLLSLILSVTVLSTMMYCIGVVWGCYKYLKYREIFSCPDRMRSYSLNPSRSNGGDDTEMLLPPKYEDVVRMSQEQAPPPAYANEN